ncbi:PREDICTED: probable WRKY transcription factor 75 [Camelina sativa]|uniref:Probable WRKY transcription factor 75 n=1 Tax=Camelina sativa TaxID=90675 RepID=A0ABM0T2C1_CAMSA|nr:PREDICTED: probable WRKY transcription factor 75 [Camelina sativa]
MEGYDNGSLYAPSFLSLKSLSKRDHELHQGEEDEGSKARSEGSSRSNIELKKKGKKKQRYAFQTRSQVDILDDGYRWRKYGQKAVKNNKFPRSYYRCTYKGCNVKKQVQRLTADQEVVVTTYEGVHSHPIEKSTENFEHILTQMQIYSSF